MKPCCILQLLIAILLLPGALTAQDPPSDLADRSPEELMNIQVYSASKFAQRVSDAPAFVTVITADDIRNYGYRTLGDILESVPGFYVTNDRNYSYLGIRGFSRPADYSTRVLLMIDGHRINDNIYDTAPIGAEFPLDVDLIERVEIIRGPSSSLYGTSAFFGVIDVITRRGRDINGAEVAFDAGSFGSYKERVTYGNVLHGIEMLFSASHYDSDGHTLYFPEFNTPETNNGITSHTDDDASRDFYGSLAWREWTLRGTYSHREKGIPNGILGAVFGDPSTRSVDQGGYIDLSYDKSFRNWELLGIVSFDQYDFTGRYSCPAGICAEEPTIEVELATGKWVISELKISRAVRFRQKLTAGVEFKDNFQQDQESAGHPERHNSRQSGVYGEDEIQLHPKVVLNLGARYDHHSIFGGTTSPRAAVILKPFKKTSIKLLYGLASRVPTAFEYYSSALTSSTVTRILQPETGRTYEIVWEQGLSKNLQFTTSAYSTDVNSLITENLDVAAAEISFANTTSTTSKGLEFQLVGKFPHFWETRAGFNVQKTTDEFTDAVLANSPRNLAKLNLSGPIWRKKLFVGVDAQYTGARGTLADNRLGAYPMLNVTLLAKRLGRRVDASFSVYDLIDHRYADPGAEEDPEDSIMRDGRSFRLKLVYHLGRKMRGRTPFAGSARLVAGCVVTALIFIASVPGGAQQTRASEAEVKAAFVFNFAKFVEWPGSVLNESQDLVICIAGDELVASTVTQLVHGRRLNGHQLVIQRRPSDTGEFNGCHVVFLGERLRWRRSLAVLRSSAVLTIADGEEFARKGGMIAFVLESDRVRFVVNPAAGDRAGLKISSRLLALARIVQEEKGF